MKHLRVFVYTHASCDLLDFNFNLCKEEGGRVQSKRESVEKNKKSSSLAKCNKKN